MSWSIISKAALSLLFLLGGMNHFIAPRFYEKMMPSILPLWLHYVAALCEIAGAIGLWIAPLQTAAAWGLIALLIAVFPANIKAAMYPELYPQIAASKQYVRLPFQGVFIAWVYTFATR